MDSEKAAKMFVQWQTWRASFVPNGFVPESQIPDELESRKAYLQGLSKDGYPVLIFKGSRHFPCKDHLQCKSMYPKSHFSMFFSFFFLYFHSHVTCDMWHLTLPNKHQAYDSSSAFLLVQGLWYICWTKLLQGEVGKLCLIIIVIVFFFKKYFLLGCIKIEVFLKKLFMTSAC